MFRSTGIRPVTAVALPDLAGRNGSTFKTLEFSSLSALGKTLPRVTFGMYLALHRYIMADSFERGTKVGWSELGDSIWSARWDRDSGEAGPIRNHQAECQLSYPDFSLIDYSCIFQSDENEYLQRPCIVPSLISMERTKQWRSSECCSEGRPAMYVLCIDHALHPTSVHYPRTLSLDRRSRSPTLTRSPRLPSYRKPRQCRPGSLPDRGFRPILVPKHRRREGSHGDRRQKEEPVFLICGQRVVDAHSNSGKRIGFCLG